MPAYNAAAHLAGVLARIPAECWPEIVSLWIVNDGSTDGTAETARQLAAENEKVKVFDFEHNQGYGTAVRKGLELCAADGCDMAVCLHSDGQYAPEMIPVLVDALEKRSLDIVQGSRIASGTALSGGMPLYKFAANRVLTFFENVVFGLHMTDYHSGYLLYGRHALQALPFERLSSSFDFDLEVIASARGRGLRVGEVPIPTRYAEETSHLNPVTYGLRVLRVIARYLMGGYRA